MRGLTLCSSCQGGCRLAVPNGASCAEAVWSHLKRSIGNLAVHGVIHLQAITKNRLRSIQYRTDMLDGFLATPA
jgi:hypothetical protein